MNKTKTILCCLLIGLVSGCSMPEVVEADKETNTNQIISQPQEAAKEVNNLVVNPPVVKPPKPKLVFKDFSVAKVNTEDEYITTKNVVFSTSGSVIFGNLTETTAKKDSRYGRVMSAIENHEKEKPQNWDDLVASVREEENPVSKLKLANSIINKVPYKDGTDGTYYHPAKLFKKGGVCKDMAMGKYLLLKDAGYPVEDLRVVALTPRIDSPDSPLHVVLVANADNNDYVLDLLPSNLAEQERKDMKLTKKAQIKKIHEAGIDLNDVSVNDNGFYELKKYKSERGLIWAGNETGAKEKFEPIRTKPSRKKAS